MRAKPGPAGSSELASGVLKGDPAACGRALSLVINEDEGFGSLMKALFSRSGKGHKIGISGPPGGGKSSLISRMISHYRKAGEKIGILAVDPTSPFTGGAFLGDRLRVQEHAMDAGVFFRSLGSRGGTGGLSATIFGAIHVLEAYGCDRILIETIGTGQDEVEISRVADTILYVTAPSLGDEIQAMKAGAMEAADIFVVNKAELAGSDKAVGALRSALELGSAGRSQWPVPVAAVSAVTGMGVPELAGLINGHQEHLASTREGETRRRLQLREELFLFISRRLAQDVLSKITDRHVESLVKGQDDPVSLGETLIRGFRT